MIKHITGDDELWDLHIEIAAESTFTTVAGADQHMNIEELMEWLQRGAHAAYDAETELLTQRAQPAHHARARGERDVARRRGQPAHSERPAIHSASGTPF